MVACFGGPPQLLLFLSGHPEHSNYTACDDLSSTEYAAGLIPTVESEDLRI